MRFRKINRGVDYTRRLKLLKSNLSRIVVRFTNRSCIIQKVSPGFNIKGDKIQLTKLFHKSFKDESCNVENIQKFYHLIFKDINLKDTILDIGFKDKKCPKVQKLINIYHTYKNK